MKICYLTWGETPRSYGVYGSQVINQFVETSKYMQGSKFYFISAVPLIHSGFVREKWLYFRELREVRRRLLKIDFFSIPIFAPQTFVNSSKLTFYLFHGFSHWLLNRRLRKINPDVVHCRSYHAAWAALKVKEKKKYDYKIVFDGRGLWAEEIAMKKNYSDDSLDYLFLKSIERELLLKTDVSVAVSDTMEEYYKKFNAKKTKCIYLSTSINDLKVECNRDKNIKGRINFGYVGALSNNTWHQLEELHELYGFLRNLGFKTKLTIVTTSSHETIKDYFKDLPNDELVLTSTKTHNELKEILKTFNFGLMAYFIPKNNREILLGKMVLAVKIVEYLAAGVPVIVNKYCGGASYLIKENKLGISYSPESFVELTENSIKEMLEYKSREQISKFAEEEFDYSVNAQRYRDIYLNC